MYQPRACRTPPGRRCGSRRLARQGGDRRRTPVVWLQAPCVRSSHQRRIAPAKRSTRGIDRVVRCGDPFHVGAEPRPPAQVQGQGTPTSPPGSGSGRSGENGAWMPGVAEATLRRVMRLWARGGCGGGDRAPVPVPARGILTRFRSQLGGGLAADVRSTMPSAPARGPPAPGCQARASSAVALPALPSRDSIRPWLSTMPVEGDSAA